MLATRSVGASRNCWADATLPAKADLKGLENSRALVGQLAWPQAAVPA